MKNSKKVLAYKQAKQDRIDAQGIVKDIRERIKGIDVITVSSAVSISLGSTDKQFVYAVGVLESQISGATKLGIEAFDYDLKLLRLMDLWNLSQELKPWDTYSIQLYQYEKEVYALLSDDELFQLMEYPTKPSEKE